MSKMPSDWSVGHLQSKLWAKEGPGVKLAVWLPTTKSWESTSSRSPNWECNLALERSRQGLQLWFRPRCDQTLQSGVMSSQNPRTLIGTISGQFRDNFGTPTWESREKEPFGCSPRNVAQKILYGGRWWLPPSPGCGESCVSKCPWLVPTPKGVPECELTTLWFVLDAESSLIF
jgi:hypothetical protein